MKGRPLQSSREALQAWRRRAWRRKAVGLAIPPDTRGPLDELIAPLCEAHPGCSGARLVTEGTDAFAMRVLSARHAVRSLDLQYYIWHSDTTGQYLSQEVLRAADRGVRVRLLLDDMDARSRDAVLMALDQHPHIEIRLFNPFAARFGTFRTLRELFSRVSRLNHRMHNKAWIADGRLALVGGRNIGDEYFAAGRQVNFVDLDAALVGPVVEHAAEIFDLYWNCEAAVPITNLRRTRRNRFTLEEVRHVVEDLVDSVAATEHAQALTAIPGLASLFEGDRSLMWTPQVRLVADDPRKAITKEKLSPGVLDSLEQALRVTREEALLISPYFVPGPGGTMALRTLTERGVRVRVLTNSLAATDVAAVHSGYARYRKPLLEANIGLFELKTAPEEDEHEHKSRLRVGSSRASLHTKAAVLDREWVFVGSFNLDPRSATLNCEMGVWISDTDLARQLTQMFQRATEPTHSFAVNLREGRLTWVEQADGHVVETHREPNASWGRRILAAVLQLLPIESQL